MTALTDAQVAQYRARIPSATEREPMAKHTSFRLGGAARLYVVVATADALQQALAAATRLEIPWVVYGGGSNLLVADEGYEGVVIQMALRGLEFEGTRVRAEAGVITGMVARQSVERGLTGFEWAIGVPGTIGGAIFGNAGCYGGEMKDAIESVEAYRVHDGTRVVLSREECGFGYRESRFKHDPHVILGCTLVLAPSPDPAASKQRMEEIMRMRKEKQPLDQSSCGCVFKNFTYEDPSALDLLAREVEIPETMRKNRMISAGWLIDHAGMLGERMGGVEVSKKHGNFFVITGPSRAQDVIALMSRVKMAVRDRLGIELQDEVQYLGF